MKRHKIFLVSNTSWSFVKFREGLIKMLLSSGFHVTLLAPRDEDTPKLEEFGANYIPLKHLAPKGLNPISDFFFLLELRKIYKRESPDLVIQYTIKPNIYSSIIAHWFGVPCIAVVTGLGYTYIKGGWVSWVSNLLYRYAFRRASEVWFLNEADKHIFVERKIVDRQKVVVIHGEGINTRTKFNPETVKVSHLANHDRIKFIFVGRLLYDKGIREYVAAAKLLKERYDSVQFSVLGYLNVENPSALQCEQLDTWIDEGVIDYLGNVDDVRSVMMGHDCLVLPSYREGMSTTLQEGAALALPLIATDIPGCRELIDDGVNGYLCKVKDVGSLVEKMEAYIHLSSAKKNEMGQCGRQKMIDEFSEDNVFQVYREHIRELLA